MSKKINSLNGWPYCIESKFAVVDGFSLIEVMVTMIILAFGMLGVAGLLVGGVSNAASSEATAKATQLSADMADRMRANPTVAISASSEYITSYTDTAPSSPASVAQLDKQVWMNALATQLPGGVGKITVDNTNRKVVIQVRWSNCMGTLSDAEKTTCTDNPATGFKYVNFELRM
jgi:type IV pilus assembly protein PilV